MNPQAPKLFTIGHSTHSITTFIGLLAAHKIEALADVRRFPASRYNPQFDRAALERSLRAVGISYHHMVSLGGRREGLDYADYAKTEPFQVALSLLEELAAKQPTVVMCAEALPANCHRRFIAAAVERDGFAVKHILSPSHSAEAERSPTLPGL